MQEEQISHIPPQLFIETVDQGEWESTPLLTLVSATKGQSLDVHTGDKDITSAISLSEYDQRAGSGVVGKPGVIGGNKRGKKATRNNAGGKVRTSEVYQATSAVKTARVTTDGATQGESQEQERGDNGEGVSSGENATEDVNLDRRSTGGAEEMGERIGG